MLKAPPWAKFTQRALGNLREDCVKGIPLCKAAGQNGVQSDFPSPRLKMLKNTSNFSQVFTESMVFFWVPACPSQNKIDQNSVLSGSAIISSFEHSNVSPIEFQGRRCDPNSVGCKNYSQVWGYRMRLLSSIFFKMALATKCQFIFNNLEKRTRLNTVIFCPYEMPSCFWKTLLWGTHFPYKMPLLFFKSKVWKMFFCYKMPIWFW